MCLYYSKASFLNTHTSLLNSFLRQHPYVSVTQQLPSSTPIRLSFSTTSFFNTRTSQLLKSFFLQHPYVSTQQLPSSTPIRLSFSTTSFFNTHSTIGQTARGIAQRAYGHAAVLTHFTPRVFSFRRPSNPLQKVNT